MAIGLGGWVLSELGEDRQVDIIEGLRCDVLSTANP